jgi:hypothetical protein
MNWRGCGTKHYKGHLTWRDAAHIQHYSKWWAPWRHTLTSSRRSLLTKSHKVSRHERNAIYANKAQLFLRPTTRNVRVPKNIMFRYVICRIAQESEKYGYSQPPLVQLSLRCDFHGTQHHSNYCGHLYRDVPKSEECNGGKGGRGQNLYPNVKYGFHCTGTTLFLYLSLKVSILYQANKNNKQTNQPWVGMVSKT